MLCFHGLMLQSPCTFKVVQHLCHRSPRVDEASGLWCVGFSCTGAVSGSDFRRKYSLITSSCLAFLQG